MKLHNIATGLLLSLAGGSGFAAYDVTLMIQGAISSGGCTLTAGSKNLSVDMGKVADEELTGPKHGGSEKLFQIQLENCASDTGGARISFSGPVDTLDPTLLAIQKSNAAATGVGIALLNHEHQPVTLNQQGNFVIFGDSDQPKQTLTFYARYTANGDAVQPGEANASATFTVEYQ